MGILVEKLTHVYMPGTLFEARALSDVDLEVRDGEFLGIIGPTGSGKSTLIQHFNGLLKPTSGRVFVDGEDINEKGVNVKRVRQKVGVIFQYPEHQLFEETVYKDIAFGPTNLGLDQDEIRERVLDAAEMVGLDEGILERSPFELSGGQMRRVAIAGVLAMKPKILVLDEPTAGLDPRGRREILSRIKGFQRRDGITVVLVSHSMEDVAKLAERLVVMDRGRIVLEGTPRQVFKEEKLLDEIGLSVPHVARLAHRLASKGAPISGEVLTVDEAEAAIVSWLEGRRCPRLLET